MLSSVPLFFSSSLPPNLLLFHSPCPYSAAIHLNNTGTRATMESHYKRSVAYRFTIAPGPDTQNILFPNPHARTTEFIILSHGHCFAKLNVYLDTSGKFNVPFRVHSPGVIRFQRPLLPVYLRRRSLTFHPFNPSQTFRRDWSPSPSFFHIPDKIPFTQFSYLLRFSFWELGNNLKITRNRKSIEQYLLWKSRKEIINF